MSHGLLETTYNPDVLSCLANLSNDEVFTPPDIVNQMLDELPQKLFENPNTTFLDPACKSGVFLREIAKRLNKGLEKEIPDIQERLDHIYKKQLFGIAITELTGLMSRRSLYCTKYPNSEYSVVRFDDPQGNIRFKRCEHHWDKDGKCFCGASKEIIERGTAFENYAYEFIHVGDPEEIFKMKFDVIVGNVPYQMETGTTSRQAKPIYPYFINQALKLNPKYLTMITPSRWFAGGMGLSDFRTQMMNDRHITKIVDYANAKDCFPQNSISGGVSYFVWDKEANGNCEIVNIINNKTNKAVRSLNEFPILVRNNNAVSILHKIQTRVPDSLEDMVSSISPFGIPTTVKGKETQEPNSLGLLTSQGLRFIPKDTVKKGFELISKYKVAVSQTGAEHAGEPDKKGMFRVLTSSMRVLKPDIVTTHSYLTVGNFSNYHEAENLLDYLKTKFVRFLILQAVSSIHISKKTFCFVPLMNFSKKWTDEDLYEYFGLTDDEIELIEETIKSF